MLNKQTGLPGATKLKDFVGKFFAYEPNDFVDTCPDVPPFSFGVTTEIFILYDFPHAVLPDYPLETKTNGGITGNVIWGTSAIVNPGNPYQSISND